MKIDWKTYNPGNLYDEMISTPGNARIASRGLASYLQSLSDKELARRQRAAELSIPAMGVTFTVYTDGDDIDRAWPFDIIPRIIAQKEWTRIEEGLKQRVRR